MANKTDMTPKHLGLRTSVMAVASCLVLSGIPLAAHAAGLGKIAVLSALGQPLRAEIELSATREELSDMKAQLASPDAFKQAGLDYATTLLSIRFSMDKRANGQSVIRLTSDKPINDPFVDMLLELNWPTGRLVREYTFLLDPPEVAAKGFPPVAPAIVRPALSVSKPPVPVTRMPAPIDDELRSKAMAKVRVQETTQQPAQQPAERRDVREVKRGDTLRKIASETKPEGVSLEQMLVGLLRANQEAFDGGNMNRLKAGKILSLPEKAAVEAVSTGDASKIVVAQSSDWNAYRSKLAGIAAQTPVKESTARQESGGKITAKVDDKATPAAEPKDQLKVSPTETAASKSAAAAAKRSEEDQIAKEKALNEAKQRLVTLEKNVADLQKLVELKNQSLAELQKQAAEKAALAEVKKPVEQVKPPPAPPVPPPAPVIVAPPPKPEPVVEAAVVKPVEKPVEVKPPEPVAKAVEAKPEPEPKVEHKPVEAVKPVEAPKAKPLPPLTPVPEEPGLVDGLLDNPLVLLVGGGGILAIIAAYFVVRRRRARMGEAPLGLGSSLSQQFSGLTANSIFRSTGGQSVDTSHGPAQTDFSQAGPGSIDTDEVDPVAEADVYMAYGRDVQAEEILVEARQKDPKRYAIHLKLLEIYSNRKDLQQFETLATDLYTETGGVGADWEKAVAMGLKLEPGNPLFGGSAQEAPAAPAVPTGTAAFDANATVVVTPQAMKQTVSTQGELSQSASVASTSEPVAVPVAAPDLTSLDFDLGRGDNKASATSQSDSTKATMADTLKLPAPVVDEAALDFDLAVDSPLVSNITASVPAVGLDFDFPDISTAETPQVEAKNEPADLDFDIDNEPSSEEITEFQVGTRSMSSDVLAAASDDDLGVRFDVSLTESTFLGQSLPEPSSFDLSSIDLDLKEPELIIPSPPPPPVIEDLPAPDSSFERIQVSTAVNPNFEIAQAETLISPRVVVEQDLPQHPDVVASEEVTTKLDLAKAYEEMGDFEGARELLQEVLKEGDATQRTKAQLILAKIGE